MKVGWIITGYNQVEETLYTVDMLRNKWARTKNSLISIVMSGDPERKIQFPLDDKTRTCSIDNIVGKDFNNLVSSSICKAIRHAILELRDLERIHGEVDFIVHMHSDILLLSEPGFFAQLENFLISEKLLACDTVGPQNNPYIHFDGMEIMPQLFVMKKEFLSCLEQVILPPENELEKKSTEWWLRRVTYGALQCFEWEMPSPILTEQQLHDKYLYYVNRHRSSQWGSHSGWGGFCHHGNEIHFTREETLIRNACTLENNGVKPTW